MREFENNAFFWQKIDTLVFSNQLEILRKRGENHPEYKNLVYPVDYGRLKDTQEEGSEGITVFKGTDTSGGIAIVVAADILKKDLQVKLLINCSDEETEKILEFLNQTDLQKTVYMQRGDEIPTWGFSD